MIRYVVLMVIVGALAAADRSYWTVVEVMDHTGAEAFEILESEGRSANGFIREREQELMDAYYQARRIWQNQEDEGGLIPGSEKAEKPTRPSVHAVSRPQRSERRAEQAMARLIKEQEEAQQEKEEQDTRPVVLSRYKLHAPEEMIRDWAARLRDRLAEKLEAGKEVRFHYSMVQQEVIVTDVAEDELAITGTSSGLQTSINAWKGLDIEDAINLAVGMVERGNKEDHAMAAFFLLCRNRTDDALDHLHRAGKLGDDVKELFDGAAVAGK